jgi:membrane protease YdiL (CAAX protease family)
MNNKFFLKIIFYFLIVIFVFLLLYFLLPVPIYYKQRFFSLAAILGVLFFILGLILVFFAFKEKKECRVFLLLAGISAMAPLIFSILHNLFYGLAMNFIRFRYVFETLHIISFVIALVIAPITFITGAIGVFICSKQNK